MNPQTERAAAIVEQYGCKTENLIAILQDIQAAYNYLSEANLTLVAQRLGISVSKVYSVATFYENFSLEAKGKHIIKVCAGTACHVRKSGPIYDAIYEYLGLSGKRKTSDDGMFTLETVACLGACGLAPVMTVDGEPVESWEYLYMVTYSAQNLSYYGVTDLSTQLGEGFTAADYVAQQAEAQVKQQAAVRKWAKDMGITLTEDDGATLQQQKEAYGEDLQKVLQINGLTEEQYDQLMSTTLLYNRLYAAYCTTDGALRPSDKDLLALAEEHSLMTADVLFISTAELDDAAKADAKALMGDYARQLSTADDKAAAFAALEAGENVTVLASNTYDGCDETTLNKALAALAEDQVSDVIEDETGYYVALRRAVDLNAVAEMAFGEDLSARISGAQVEHNDSVYNAIDLTSFYARYTAGQQKLYAQLTAEQPQG